jgi:energy-coupling factor transport system permease protein
MWLLLVATAIGSVFTPFMAVRDTRTLYTLSPLIISYGFVQGALLICAGLLMMLLLSSVLPITALQAMWRRNWPRRMKGLLVVVTIATFIALCLVGHPAPDQPYIIGPWRITYGGTWLVVSISTGLLSLYALSLLLTMTTTPVALIEGLSMLLSPLRRLKLPVDDFALMTLLALRFIPTLIEEAEHLIQAQMARGADMTSGTFRERLQSLTILLVPLLRGVLRRAAELATALEARGYEVTGQQTQLHESSLHTIDYIVLVTVILVTVGALLL